MKMRTNDGNNPIERQFICDAAGSTLHLTYTYRNRQDRQSGDVAFFYIDLKDAGGAVLQTINQGQQTGLEFIETVDFTPPGGFEIDDLFTVSFRPYAPEYDFYRILLVAVSLEIT